MHCIMISLLYNDCIYCITNSSLQFFYFSPALSLISPIFLLISPIFLLSPSTGSFFSSAAPLATASSSSHRGRHLEAPLQPRCFARCLVAGPTCRSARARCFTGRRCLPSSAELDAWLTAPLDA